MRLSGKRVWRNSRIKWLEIKDSLSTSLVGMGEGHWLLSLVEPTNSETVEYPKRNDSLGAN